MLDKAKKKTLVYKPYQKGIWHSRSAVKKGLKLLAYFALFAFIYLVPGSVLQFGSPVLRVGANLIMLLVCAGIVYMDGVRLGESEVAYGEIVYNRGQAGHEITRVELERCFHPLKGLFIMLVAAVPVALLALPHALTAAKQTYSLQTLPGWVTQTMKSYEDVAAPLQYYQRDVAVTARDILGVAVRLLVFPFVNIANPSGPDATLLVDRLSPLLAWLPAAAFPIGYLTGPRTRAQIHGNIKTNRRRYNSRQRKEAKARRARTEKKNELN